MRAAFCTGASAGRARHRLGFVRVRVTVERGEQLPDAPFARAAAVSRPQGAWLHPAAATWAGTPNPFAREPPCCGCSTRAHAVCAADALRSGMDPAASVGARRCVAAEVGVLVARILETPASTVSLKSLPRSGVSCEDLLWVLPWAAALGQNELVVVLILFVRRLIALAILS